MRVIEKADIAPLEPLLCSIQAGTAIIGRSERFIIAVAQELCRVTAAGEGNTKHDAPPRRLKRSKTQMR